MGAPRPFDPPGAGQWQLDRSHYPGGTTPISQWLLEETMEAGMGRVFAELGVPARCVRMRFVNGFSYTRLIPLIGGDRPPRRLPPAPVLRAATRLHPEFRTRRRAAEAALRDRPALGVARRWDSEIRPRLEAVNRRFQSTPVDDPGLVDDVELQGHIVDLLEHVRTSFELHFYLHGHDLGPTARLLHTLSKWGHEPADVIPALVGSSPSTRAPLEALVALRAELGGAHPTTLDGVRAHSPDAARLLDEYLSRRGDVLATGYDITALTLNELPGSVLAGIATATLPSDGEHESVLAALRERIDPANRAEFDELVADARAVTDMRDDNGPVTAEWPMGLLRRALLAAGRRLAERGQLDEPEHVLEVTPAEARGLFGLTRPAAAELAERCESRLAASRLDPPPTLGAPEPEPPLDVMPTALADIVASVQVALRYLGMDAAPASTTDPLVGAGVGLTSYRGRVRRAESADEAIERLEPGEVLVVRATSPAFNAVLTIAGAIVTSHGGPLSHAAVIARELGIPAVVGAPGALDLADGSTVDVDPVAGRISLV